jgi:hypothetical protein
MARSFFDAFSVNSIVTVLLGRVGQVVRREIDLAKQELTRKVKGLLTGGILLALAMGLAMGALTLLAVAGVAALTLVWPLWLSALVGGGGLLVLALIFLAIGSSKIKKNKDLRPERAVSALKRFSHEVD